MQDVIFALLVILGLCSFLDAVPHVVVPSPLDILKPSPSLQNDDLNLSFLSDHTRRIYLSNRTEQDIKLDCAAQRKKSGERAKDEGGTSYIPACQKNNETLYSKIQCHSVSKYCWCVQEISGEPIPGTSVLSKRPDCEKKSKVVATTGQSKKKVVFKNCKGRRRAKFFKRLLNAVRTEIIMSGGGSEVSKEKVLRWKFDQLDANHNQIIERKEWKPYKAIIRQWKRVKTCSRNFFRFCDLDRNRRVTVAEWETCTVQIFDVVDPRHTHPFLDILKPE